MNREDQRLHTALAGQASGPEPERRVDWGALVTRLDALETRVATLEAGVPMTIPQPEPPHAEPVEADPILVVPGKPKRTVGAHKK